MTSKRKLRGTRSSAFKNNSIASTKKSNRRRNHMLSQAQRTTILELNAQQVSKREIARVTGDLPRGRAQSSAIQLHHCAGTESSPESRTAPATDPGAFREV